MERPLRQDNIKSTNIHLIQINEKIIIKASIFALYGTYKKKRDREKEPDKISEDIIAENFPYMRKKMLIHIQEAQRVTYRLNPRRNKLRHILRKWKNMKDKEKY